MYANRFLISMTMNYLVHRIETSPDWDFAWDGAIWSQAQTATVDQPAAPLEAPAPITQVRLLHDNTNLYGLFRVQDHSILARQTKYNSWTCFDSCVEFFFRPRPDSGYFNLEMSASGAHLLYYVRDWTPVGDYYADFTAIPEADGQLFETRSSLTELVPQERKCPITWLVQFMIPMTVAEKYCGPIGALANQRWTGNFYKCGDNLNPPHWLAWSPVSSLNFHLPECFGEWLFD
jgi:hypothetical protein